MKESAEKIIKIGFIRSPTKICDEIERVTAEMIRGGWSLRDSLVEDGLACIHLFFEREIDV